MSKVRFGIIGTNFITIGFLQAARRCEEFELKAIYSRSLDKAKAFVEELVHTEVLKDLHNGDILFFDSLEEMALCQEIDAVYIASPTAFHYEQSIMMMEKRKHVFCEKPVASNLREWKRMQKVADENHVTILEAMRPLFNPGFEVIKNHLVELGTIRKVNFNYCQYSSRYDKYKNGTIENAFKPELSNGALMDIGIYCIAVMAGLFGRPLKINATGYILPESIDGMGSITASYDGMQADLVYSKISDSKNPCEIQGEKGTMIFSNIRAPQDICIRYRDGSEVEIHGSRTDICRSLVEHRASPVEPLESTPKIQDSHRNSVSGRSDMADMVNEVAAFMEFLSGKCQLAPYHQISTITMEILDEARRRIGIVFPADERK